MCFKISSKQSDIQSEEIGEVPETDDLEIEEDIFFNEEEDIFFNEEEEVAMMFPTFLDYLKFRSLNHVITKYAVGERITCGEWLVMGEEDKRNIVFQAQSVREEISTNMEGETGPDSLEVMFDYLVEEFSTEVQA